MDKDRALEDICYKNQALAKEYDRLKCIYDCLSVNSIDISGFNGFITFFKGLLKDGESSFNYFLRRLEEAKLALDKMDPKVKV